MKRSKPSCSTDPKSVPPMQRVCELPTEELTRSGGKFFCNACREEVLLKLSIILSKHVAGREALVERKFCERDIAKAVQMYDEQEQPSGQTFPETQWVYRLQGSHHIFKGSCSSQSFLRLT